MRLARTNSDFSEQDQQTYVALVKESRTLETFHDALETTRLNLLDHKGKPSKTADKQNVPKYLLDVARTLEGESKNRATMLAKTLVSIAGGKTGGPRAFAATSLPLIQDEINRTTQREALLWEQRAPFAAKRNDQRIHQEAKRALDDSVSLVKQMRETTAAVRGVWADALAEEALRGPEANLTGLDATHPANLETTEAFDKYVDQISLAASPGLEISQTSPSRNVSKGIGL